MGACRIASGNNTHTNRGLGVINTTLQTSLLRPHIFRTSWFASGLPLTADSLVLQHWALSPGHLRNCRSTLACSPCSTDAVRYDAFTASRPPLSTACISRRSTVLVDFGPRTGERCQMPRADSADYPGDIRSDWRSSGIINGS